MPTHMETMCCISKVHTCYGEAKKVFLLSITMQKAPRHLQTSDLLDCCFFIVFSLLFLVTAKTFQVFKEQVWVFIWRLNIASWQPRGQCSIIFLCEGAFYKCVLSPLTVCTTSRQLPNSGMWMAIKWTEGQSPDTSNVKAHTDVHTEDFINTLPFNI